MLAMLSICTQTFAAEMRFYHPLDRVRARLGADEPNSTKLQELPAPVYVVSSNDEDYRTYRLCFVKIEDLESPESVARAQLQICKPLTTAERISARLVDRFVDLYKEQDLPIRWEKVESYGIHAFISGVVAGLVLRYRYRFIDWLDYTLNLSREKVIAAYLTAVGTFLGSTGYGSYNTFQVGREIFFPYKLDGSELSLLETRLDMSTTDPQVNVLTKSVNLEKLLVIFATMEQR